MKLPIMEIFYTLQGEGKFQGQAACFIRIAGCDVGCTWCDIKESWNEKKYPLHTLSTIIQTSINITPLPNRIAVITGGEPLLYNLEHLTTQLKQHQFKTHIETSGSKDITGIWDWICISPKKFKPPLPSTLSQANELKIIIYHPSDFTWAEKYAMQVKTNCQLYLQPEWSKKEQMIPLMINYIKTHPQWKLSMQIHKYIGIP